MKIYIDLFLGLNFLMDLIIVTSVGIILKRKTNIFRLLFSSFLGSIVSLLLFLKINGILISIISIFLISFVAYRFVSIRYTINNIFYIYLLSVIIGGTLYLFNIKVSDNIFLSYLIIIVIALEVAILYVKKLKKLKNTYNNYYDVCIVFKGGDRLNLIGFFDSGNNLYDPYLKRPIILISSKYEKIDKYILVPYYTVNNEGLLKCIKIDSLYINNKIVKEEVLVSFSKCFKFMDGVDVILHGSLERNI